MLPQLSNLQDALAGLLGVEVRRVIYMSRKGYAQQVHHVQLWTTTDGPIDLVVKELDDPSSIAFYEDVLVPFQLDAPPLYGTMQVDSVEFLVEEFIPHTPTNLQDQRHYECAVDWLLKKDAIASRNLPRLKTLDSIHPFFLGVDCWAELLDRGAEVELHPALTSELIPRICDQMAHWEDCLASTKQTLRHNDFQLQNILLCGHQPDEMLYVIDWTCPNIGSVYIDFAMLLHTAPSEFKSCLIERFVSRHECDRIDEGLRSAEAHVALSVLVNLVEAALKGCADRVQRTYIGKLANRLTEACRS